MNRRNFIKGIGAGVSSLILPSLVQANQEKLPQNNLPLEKSPLEYFDKIYCPEAESSVFVSYSRKYGWIVSDSIDGFKDKQRFGICPYYEILCKHENYDEAYKVVTEKIEYDAKQLIKIHVEANPEMKSSAYALLIKQPITMYPKRLYGNKFEYYCCTKIGMIGIDTDAEWILS